MDDMRVEGQPFRTIWLTQDRSVSIIDQTQLPHRFEVRTLATLEESADAIRHMRVRGAPLIGATAAYGIAIAMLSDARDANLAHARKILLATRPTAINLRWALDRMQTSIEPLPIAERAGAAFARAQQIADEDVMMNAAIGDHGVPLIRTIAFRKRGKVNILTHCNAGWLATVDWGTATSPIYKAHDVGIPVHVWVDETRPRNQGAALTAWELGQHGVPHTVIVDNAGGHLMQHGGVDMVIVGTDRTTASGDVCNKIGTYLKALAARDNDIPFYVAAPSPSIDFDIEDGVRDVPIETRDVREVTHISGVTDAGSIATVRITPAKSLAHNPAFDVTPSRLVNGLITEKGIIEASTEALAAAFPERTGRRSRA
jgi:methylthioribose-1-phosphate isomerase